MDLMADPNHFGNETEYYAPPRMSQEVNPQNLADLFSADPECAPKSNAPLQQQQRALAFAGCNIDEELDIKKLQVFVRIRPIQTNNNPQLDNGSCIQACSQHTLAVAPPETSLAYKSGDRGQTYSFTQVFDASTSQESYYNASAAPLVYDLLCNPHHNSVMMAYGVTAAGKTHTIEGTASSPGVLPRALDDIFRGIKTHNDASSLSLRVSYCEIYNESIYDLLKESNSSSNGVRQRTPLRLMEDARGRVIVAGLSEIAVASAEEALAVVKKGAKHRQRAETGLNYSSSRSHSICTIHLIKIGGNGDCGGEKENESAMDINKKKNIEHGRIINGKIEHRLGRISFVDLAGSERAQRTGNIGIRFKESVAINASLMTLGRCLESLRYNQQLKKHQNQHQQLSFRVIPYRESKVTHLFRDILHGYGKIILSVNVSPSPQDYDETSHVLKYAAMSTQIGTLHQVEAPRRTLVASTTPSVLHVHRERVGEIQEKEEEEMAVNGLDHRNALLCKDVIGDECMHKDYHSRHKIEEKEEEIGDGDMIVYDIRRNTLAATPAADTQEHDNSTDDYNGDGTIGTCSTHRLPVFPLEQTPLGPDHCNADTPNNNNNNSNDNNNNAANESDDDDEHNNNNNNNNEVLVSSLQTQVQQLIADLQAAEERAVLIEGEIRDEVAVEMAQLLKDMEESYKERLAKEIAVMENRIPSIGTCGTGTCGTTSTGTRSKDIAATPKKKNATLPALDNKQQSPTTSERVPSNALTDTNSITAAIPQSETTLLENNNAATDTPAHIIVIDALKNQLSSAEDRAEQACKDAASAREQLRCITALLEEERAHAMAAMAAALTDVRRRAGDEDGGDGARACGPSTQLRHKVTQIEANRNMELEMAEQQTERLRKENIALKQQLAAAMATLESVSSPTRTLVQRIAALCPPNGNGRGAGGTPHDIALARARQSAKEDEIHEKQRSRFAEEFALLLSSSQQAENVDLSGGGLCGNGAVATPREDNCSVEEERENKEEEDVVVVVIDDDNDDEMDTVVQIVDGDDDNCISIITKERQRNRTSTPIHKRVGGSGKRKRPPPPPPIIEVSDNEREENEPIVVLRKRLPPKKRTRRTTRNATFRGINGTGAIGLEEDQVVEQEEGDHQ